MKRTLISAGLVMGILLSAPAAHAGTQRHVDATGDALVEDTFNSGATTPPQTDPDEKRGDITRLTAVYSRSELRIGTSMRNRGGLNPRFKLRIVTSRGHSYDIGYSSGAASGLLVTRDGERYRCDGIMLNPTSAGYLATIPGECLDFAYRVRVGAQTIIFASSGGPVRRREIHDDALRTGKVTKRQPQVGPWIVAG